MARPGGSNAAAMLHAMSDRMSLAGITCPEETVRLWATPSGTVFHSAQKCSRSQKVVSDVPATSAMAGSFKLCTRKQCKESWVIHSQPNNWIDWLEAINVMLDAAFELDCVADGAAERAERRRRLSVIRSQLSSKSLVVHPDNATFRSKMLDRISEQLDSAGSVGSHEALETVCAGHILDVNYGFDDYIKQWSPGIMGLLENALPSSSSYWKRPPAQLAGIILHLSDKLLEGCSTVDAKASALEEARRYVATLTADNICGQKYLPVSCRFNGVDFDHPTDWAFAEWSAEVFDCLEGMIDEALKFAFRGIRRGKLQLVAVDYRLDAFESLTRRGGMVSNDQLRNARVVIDVASASQVAFPELFVEGESWMFVAVPAGSAEWFASIASRKHGVVEVIPGGVRNVTPELLCCALGLISSDDDSPLSSPAEAIAVARLVLLPR